MEEDILVPAPPYKLNKEWAIFLATFLGGPLPGAYLAAENFRRLGEPEKVKWTWGIAILLLAVVVVGFLFIPAFSHIPNYILPVIFVVIARMLIKRYQEPAIQKHISEGGQIYTVWRAVLVGLIATVLILGAVFGMGLLADNIPNQR
jgi:4-amino-4-deoxy-L-arabinose transferase-like glycosyltransferase